MIELAILTADDVLEALRLWHGGEATHWPLANLRLGNQLAQKENPHGNLAEPGLVTQNRAILTLGLENLREVNPEGEELLRQRFEKRQDVMVVAHQLNVAESSLYYRQRQAIAQLTEILIQLEQDASREWRERMQARLGPPSYTELVGIEKALSVLTQSLLDKDKHFIVSIDGLGGLGKTALAHYMATQLIQTSRFEEVAWVTAKQTHLNTRGRIQIETGRPALSFPMLLDRLTNQFDLPESMKGSQLQKQRVVKQYLKERACLVIIDNLETIADYEILLPELRNWQQPTKFLLTSRLRLIDQPGVFSYSHYELSRTAVFQLIRLEADKTGFSELAQAPEKDLTKIYDLVGGNPLAIKLVVGQLRFHSLPRVLTRLAESQRNNSGIDLFDYIYYEAWEALNDGSKTTLLALTQAGETGFTSPHLAAITGFPELAIEKSLEDLILLSLVDQKGTLQERRYNLHRLTEMFLLRMLEES